MKRLASIGILPVAAIILTVLLPLIDADACTRMFWNTNGKAMLVGRNMDLDMDDQPVFYVHPRGIIRHGGVDDNNSATWTSQYGSVVVTHLGHSNFSSEGVNEAGLAFHSLWLTPARFEERDKKRAGVLQGRYGMYLLDKAATVLEALELMYQTQLVQEEVDVGGRKLKFPQHYALEDASGDSAVVEFLEDPITHKGHMHVYHGAEYNVLTNDPPFDQHFPYLFNYQYFGGDLPLPGDLNPSARFVRASAFLSTLNSATTNQAVKADAVSTMFLAIRSMSEPFYAFQFIQGAGLPAWPTFWTLVYNLTNKRIYFSHNLARNNFWINMRKLSFTEGAPVLYLDPTKAGLSGEVSKLFKPAP